MKNDWKSIGLSVVLIVSLSIVLYGCSNNREGGSAGLNSGAGSASSDSGQKVKLTWLVRTDPQMIDWEKDMIKGFQDAHPNITIELQQIPQEEIDQRLATMLAGDTMPDVFSANWSNSGFITYYNRGALLDLSPYFDKDADALSTINPDIVKLFDMNGGHYGVPMLSLGSFLFYNKDLFDAAGLAYPPTDWDDQTWNYDKMLEDAQKLTHDAGTDNQVFGILNNFSADLQAWAFGGDFFKEGAYADGYLAGQVNAVTDQSKEALQFNADLINKYHVSPNQATVTAVSAVGDPFLTGKVAMVMDGGWNFWGFADANFKWGVAPIPWKEGRVDGLYADPWNISKSSKHPNESWEFIKYLVDPAAGGKSFMQATSATPADTTLADQWNQQMADKLGMTVEQIKQVNEGAIQHGRNSVANLLVDYSTIGNTMNQTVAEIWNGNLSVEDGLAQIQKNLDALNLKKPE